MIVRVQGDGQWKLSGADIDELDRIDDGMVEAVGERDEEQFDALLQELLDCVRRHGTRLPPEALVESDLVLPPADATIDEIRNMLAPGGLVVA